MNIGDQILKMISVGSLKIWITLFAIIPLSLMLMMSFLSRHEENYISYQFNIQNYQRLLDPTYLNVFWSSIKLSALTTLTCFSLALPLALALNSLTQKGKNLGIILLMIPFWINSMARLYGLRLFISQNGFANKFLMEIGLIHRPLELMYTQFAVVIGTSYLFFPFMVLPLLTTLEKIDPSLIQAGFDLGGNWWHVFRRVTFPLMKGGVVMGSILVFLPSLSCFYAADILGGGNSYLLGNVIFGQFFEARDWPFGSTLGISSMLMIGTFLFFMGKITSK